MNQTITPPHTGLKSLKHRLFAPLMRGILAAVLLCTAWAAQAQNLTVKVNDQSPLTGQVSLQAAIEASNVQLADITSIEITAGSFTTNDWNYLKDNRYDLSSLESFSITDGISSVDDMPDISGWDSYFYRLSKFSVQASFAIGRSAFYKIHTLTTVILPKVTSIGICAFDDCSALAFLELGETPPTVGGSAFLNCSGLRFLKVDDSYVDAYKAVDDGDKTDNRWYGWRINEQPSLPLTVRLNGGSELTGNSLQEIIESSGVESIRELEVVSGDLLGADEIYMSHRFVEKLILTSATEFRLRIYNQNTLKEFSAPNLEILGNDVNTVFKYCYGLTSVKLPKATSILSGAFDECTRLFFLELGANPPKVEDGAFYKSPSPRYLKLVDANGNPLTGDALINAVAAYKADGNWNKITNTWCGWTLMSVAAMASPAEGGSVSGIGQYEPGETVTLTAEPNAGYRFVGWSDGTNTLSTENPYSFEATNDVELVAEFERLLTVKVNDLEPITKTSLEAAITASNVPLADITSIEISAGAFTTDDWTYLKSNKNDLSSLASFSITDGIASVADMPVVWDIKSTFNSSLTSVSIDASFALGRFTFYMCTALASVNLPKATSIGDGAFSGCTFLTSISLPAATSVGGAFDGCTSLTTVNLPVATTIVDEMFKGCAELSTVSMPAATSVGGYAFSGCKALNTISLPEVTSIGEAAFSGCEKLATVSLAKATEIGNNAFSSCKQLSSISLPEATRIYSSAFTGCEALVTVSMPKATSIDEYAFSNCKALEVVSLPTATVISNSVFTNCASLGTISLPAATSIKSSAFLNCIALHTVSLPAATEIVDRAFNGCEALTLLELGATPPTVGDAFQNCPSPRYLKLLAADGTPLTGIEFTTAIAAYKADGSWDAHASTWHGWSLMHVVAATANPAEGGTIAGAGQYKPGETATIQAVPNVGYHFVHWSDGTNTLSTDNPYSLNVTSNIALVAEFEINTYTLSYTASTGGSLTGELSQIVAHGQSGTEVEAVPNAGYHFVRWSDGLTTAKRTDSNVQRNINVMAEFAINTYTLSYTAGNGGSISGQATQSVQHGKSGTEVEAVTSEGYRFVKWSDGLTTAKRTDSNVQGNINAMAEFEKTNTTGLFNTQLDALSVYPNPTAGQLWVSVPELAEGTAAEVLVYNANAQLLQRVPARAASTGSAASRISIDLSSYPSGLYIVRVGNAMAKVVKQ